MQWNGEGYRQGSDSHCYYRGKVLIISMYTFIYVRSYFYLPVYDIRTIFLSMVLHSIYF